MQSLATPLMFFKMTGCGLGECHNSHFVGGVLREVMPGRFNTCVRKEHDDETKRLVEDLTASWFDLGAPPTRNWAGEKSCESSSVTPGLRVPTH